MSYYVKFKSGNIACLDGEPDRAYELFPLEDSPHDEVWQERNKWLSDEVANYAGLFEPVDFVGPVPYGFSPRIDGRPGYGDFCIHPEKCAGRYSCPRNYACSE